ncbi:hypothetical protein [Dyadobacter psychrotolerans]|uniref:hypothetical protein n=1 Tax=Dyadobacter psychrotolerans TaxID=2541721 RepID=UPI0014042C27|nr:hypothetical protein [Dyadobacter psychrotolerans]
MKKITVEQSDKITGGSKLTRHCFFVPFITLATSGTFSGMANNIAWNIACWQN